MKVFLANPPPVDNTQFIREGRCMQAKDSWATVWPPLSLMTIAGFLRKNNHEVVLRDFSKDMEDYVEVKKALEKFNPDVVVINTAFPSIRHDLKLAGVAKELNPDVKTIIFGMFSTIVPEEVMKMTDKVDFAVKGEPEWAIRDILKKLEQKKSVSKVEGIIYKEKGKLVVTKPQDLSKHNMDDLGFPARDLIDNSKYRLPINNNPFTLINLGRGCAYPCIFCIAHHFYGKPFRHRSVDSVISELKECVDKYGIKDFLFWEESFTLNRKYGEEICDKIIESGLDITWSTTTRVDTINLHLLKKMKKAGCMMVGLGIESASDEIRKTIKKFTTKEQIENAIAMCKEAGIRSMGHFIFGLPGETKETAEKTIDFALKSDLNYAQFYCAIPYPKSELGEIAEKNGWVESHDYTQYELTKSISGTADLDSKQIKKLRDKAYRKFYFRPKMAIQTMKEVSSIKSLLSSMGFLNWIKKTS